jgi:hypothetical protein
MLGAEYIVLPVECWEHGIFCAASRTLGAESTGCAGQEGMTLPEYSRKGRNCATKRSQDSQIYAARHLPVRIADLAEHDLDHLIHKRNHRD